MASVPPRQKSPLHSGEPRSAPESGPHPPPPSHQPRGLSWSVCARVRSPARTAGGAFAKHLRHLEQRPHHPLSTPRPSGLSALQRRKESLGRVPQKQAPGQGCGESGFFGGDSGEHWEGGARRTGQQGDGQCGCEGGQGRGQLRHRPTRSPGRRWGHPQSWRLTKAKGAGVLIYPRPVSWLKVTPRKHCSSVLPACPPGQGAIPQPEGRTYGQPETIPRAGNHRPGGEGMWVGPDSTPARP